MSGSRDTLPPRIPNNSLRPFSLSCQPWEGGALREFLAKRAAWKGKEEPHGGEARQTHPQPGLKVSFKGDESPGRPSPLRGRSEEGASPWGLPSPKAAPSGEKPQTNLNRRTFPPNYLPSPPQNCQVHQKQGKSEKLSRPRGS